MADRRGCLLDSVSRAGSEKAAFFGVSEGGPMSVLFAATHPERAAALVLYGAMSRIMLRRLVDRGASDTELSEELLAFVEDVFADSLIC